MITLYSFRQNLLVLMRLFIANPGMYQDIVYKGRLYRITVEDLNIEVKQKRKPRSEPVIKEVEQSKCPTCKHTVLNGVCMNTACPVNSKALALPKR